MLSVPAILARQFPPRPIGLRPSWGLAAPTGPVALTITGQICWPNTDAGLALDATLLRSVPAEEITTTTDWPKLTTPQHYRGPALMPLLRAAGWRGTDISLHGVDGYSAETTLQALRGSSAIVATEFNGMPLPCTRYAPLWLMFPFDEAPDQMTRWRKRACAVWGLTRIEVH
ncbi:MAG: molybdopterin-dependent oxidoreductase [Pseudomonadota bacterium]